MRHLSQLKVTSKEQDLSQTVIWGGRRRANRAPLEALVAEKYHHSLTVPKCIQSSCKPVPQAQEARKRQIWGDAELDFRIQEEAACFLNKHLSLQNQRRDHRTLDRKEGRGLPPCGSHVWLGLNCS